MKMAEGARTLLLAAVTVLLVGCTLTAPSDSELRQGNTCEAAGNAGTVSDGAGGGPLSQAGGSVQPSSGGSVGTGGEAPMLSGGTAAARAGSSGSSS